MSMHQIVQNQQLVYRLSLSKTIATYSHVLRSAPDLHSPSITYEEKWWDITTAIKAGKTIWQIIRICLHRLPLAARILWHLMRTEYWTNFPNLGTYFPRHILPIVMRNTSYHHYRHRTNPVISGLPHQYNHNQKPVWNVNLRMYYHAGSHIPGSSHFSVLVLFSSDPCPRKWLVWLGRIFSSRLINRAIGFLDL